MSSPGSLGLSKLGLACQGAGAAEAHRGLTKSRPSAAPVSAVPALSAAAGGRAAGRRLAGVCQQAGHAQRHGGERADRQAGAADAAQQDRECPGCHPCPRPCRRDPWGRRAAPGVQRAGDLQSPKPFSSSPSVLQWYVQATCATQGTGLYDGLDWLSHELSKR